MQYSHWFCFNLVLFCFENCLLCFALIDGVPFRLKISTVFFGQTKLTIRSWFASESHLQHNLLIIWLYMYATSQQRFFLCALLSFRFFKIISYRASKPSCSPSPVIAQADWMYQNLKELAFDVFDDDVDDIVEAWCGDVELDVDVDVCGGGVLEQFDDTSVLLLSRLFNRVSTGLWPLLMFADTGNVDCDFIICGGIAEKDSSCKPSNFSNSFGSLAPGKSCLFANINMGTPWNKSNKSNISIDYQLFRVETAHQLTNTNERTLRSVENQSFAHLIHMNNSFRTTAKTFNWFFFSSLERSNYRLRVHFWWNQKIV